MSTQAARASDLRTRVLTALVLAPLVLLITWAGGAWFALLAALTITIMAWEWTHIAHDGDARQWLVHAVAGLGGLLAGVFAARGPGHGAGAGLFLLLVVLAWAASLVLRARSRRGFTIHHLLGPPYLALAALAMTVLRLGQPERCGLHVIFLLLAVVWSADTLAYFAGRALGGPKFAPRISPNKTWSGFFGAVVGGGLAGLLFGLVSGWPAAPLMLLGALLGGFEQFGDLFESALKRRFGAKDSGAILPGHGGLLDRLDGLVAAAMLALLWGMWASGSLRDAACGVLLWGNKV